MKSHATVCDVKSQVKSHATVSIRIGRLKLSMTLIGQCCSQTLRLSLSNNRRQTISGNMAGVLNLVLDKPYYLSGEMVTGRIGMQILYRVVILTAIS